MDLTLKIMIFDDSTARAAIIAEGLREAGIATIFIETSTDHMLQRIFSVDPDVIVMSLANPRRDSLEQMFQVSRLVKRPVTMFVDQTDVDMTREAIEAGVSAYVVDGLRKERVRQIIDMCIARFNAFARLEAELAQTRDALSERKAIDQAKAHLMRSRKIDENEAYALMRRTAMNTHQTIGDIARAILTSLDLLK